MSSIYLTPANGVWGNIGFILSICLSVQPSVVYLPSVDMSKRLMGYIAPKWLEHKFDLTITLFQEEKMKGH